jgi:hypothetical protein
VPVLVKSSDEIRERARAGRPDLLLQSRTRPGNDDLARPIFAKRTHLVVAKEFFAEKAGSQLVSCSAAPASTAAAERGGLASNHVMSSSSERDWRRNSRSCRRSSSASRV